MRKKILVFLLVIGIFLSNPSVPGLAQTDSGTIIYTRWHDYTYYFYAVAPDGRDEKYLFESYDSDLARSPDGKFLIYRQMREPAEMLSMADYDLYLTDLAGSQPIQLTSTLTNGHAQWSPDGNWLAFEAGSFGLLEPRPSESRDIYLMDARQLNDGIVPEPVRLTSTGNVWGPRWSPDSSQIAFLSGGDFYCDLFVMSADGSHLRNLTENFADCVSSPDWSPAGTRIAFAAGDEIDVLEVASRKITPLTSNQVSDSNPRWSPDGTHIAFITNFAELHIINADGTNQISLTNPLEIRNIGYGAFAWSPDGTQIVFSGTPADGTAAEIFILDIETGEIHLLAGDPDQGVHYVDPTWLP